MNASASKGFYCSTIYKNQLCVLPCGRQPTLLNRNWSKSELMPYVHYIEAGKAVDSLFEGFIFHGLSSSIGGYMYSGYAGFGHLAGQPEGLQWIEDLFEDGYKLKALSQAVSQPVDVWVSIPYPHQRLLPTEEQRYLAVKYWMDRFLERLHDERSLHAALKFQGFLWQRESVNHEDESLVIRSNDYIKALHYASLWLPHYGASGVMKHRQLGFSATAVHSNYYGHTSYGKEWIDFAAVFAKSCHSGFQIRYGRGPFYDEAHFLDYLDYGLPERHGYMKNCFKVYQFPGLSLDEIINDNECSYIKLYQFVKGTYVGKPPAPR